MSTHSTGTYEGRQADDLRQMLRNLDVFAGELPTFDPQDTPDDPTTLFTEWLLEAVSVGVREPHAMTLSTVDPHGDPSARVLLLKGVHADGWRFAAHALSPKGRDLARHGRAALTFHWPRQARQIRLRGPVVPEAAEQSAADFLDRGADARAEALLGMQSRPLLDPGTREEETRRSRARVESEPGLVPPEWTLYTLRPWSVEFWQGDKQRRHTRLEYVRREGHTAANSADAGPRAGSAGWDKRLLWP